MYHVCKWMTKQIIQLMKTASAEHAEAVCAFCREKIRFSNLFAEDGKTGKNDRLSEEGLP